MNDVFLHGFARTPIGAFGGALRDVPAAALGAAAVEAALGRAGFDSGDVARLVFGCAIPADPADVLIADAVAAGLPNAVTTGVAAGELTGLEAIAVAWEALRGGAPGPIVAGGAESSSRIPYWSPGLRFGAAAGDPGVVDPLYAALPPADSGGDRVAFDAFAARSRELAASAEAPEVSPLPALDRDEAPAPSSALSALKPAFAHEGVATTGNTARPADGAAALVLSAGPSPLRVASVVRRAAALDAARDALEGRTPSLVEVHEGTAAEPLSVAAALGVEVNTAGGAIATGSPAGAAGAILVARLAARLQSGTGLALAAAPSGRSIALVLEHRRA